MLGACAYRVSAAVGRRAAVAQQRLVVGVLQVGVDVVRHVRVVGRGDAGRQPRWRPPARVHRVVVVVGVAHVAQLLVRLLAQVGHAARVLQLGLQQEARLVLRHAVTHRLHMRTRLSDTRVRTVKRGGAEPKSYVACVITLFRCCLRVHKMLESREWGKILVGTALRMRSRFLGVGRL